MSEEPQQAARDLEALPEAEAALGALEAAAGRPLAEQADAFDAFHAALTDLLDTEPAE
jgi:hypothetical protein